MRVRFNGYTVLLICAACMLAAFVLSGCSGDKGEAGGNRPVINSISPAAAEMGDTVTLSGTDFARDLSDNSVFFSPCGVTEGSCRRQATIASASVSEIRCVVPDGALNGRVWVQKLGIGSGAFPFEFSWTGPHISNDLPFIVRMEPGDVGKIIYSSESFDYVFPQRASGEEYLLILFSSARPLADDTQYWYTVSLSIPVDREVGKPVEHYADRAGIRPIHLDRSFEFDRRKRQEVYELLESAPGGAQPYQKPGSLQMPGLQREPGSPGDVSKVAIRGPGAPPQTATFRVLDDPYGDLLDPDSYVTVTADLKYTGDHTLLYVDQRTHVSCITDDEAQDLGAVFDQGIYQMNRTYFGEESDINGDSRVAILMTPEVNEMTPSGETDQGFIAGFFLPLDLLPDLEGVDPDVTNGMEIFYTLVPDPNPEYGNKFEKPWIIDTIKGILAHEFTHMIMFNYRVLIYGGGVLANYMAELWVDEGMAHMAEDLNGYNEQNILRSNEFLVDPGDANLIFRRDDSVAARGAIYLFFRLIGDLFEETTYKEIIQSRTVGRGNIEEATGESFNELVANWSAACYLDNRDITDDERFEYKDLNLQDDQLFEPLYVFDPGTSGVING
ncbi:MAG: IPT/TIG domain-containing protein, partial [bacterium]